MRRIVIVLLSLMFAYVAPAQTATTDCRALGGAVHCDTRAVPAKTALGPNCEIVQRDGGQASGRLGLLAAIGQIANDDSNRRSCAAKIAAESASIAQRWQAQWDLFLPRARMVMQASVDSLGLQDSTRARYWASASTALQNLWIVDQQAPTARMREAVEPIEAEYRRKIAQFSQRAVQAFAHAVDTIPYSVAGRNALKEALNARLGVLMGENLDASEIDMLQRMRPVLDSAKAASKQP